jgi:hypothetical protein
MRLLPKTLCLCRTVVCFYNFTYHRSHHFTSSPCVHLGYRKSNQENGAVSGTHVEGNKAAAAATNGFSVAATPASVPAKELIGYHEASRFAGDYLAGKVRRTVAQCPGLGRHILDTRYSILGFDTALAQTSLSYREWTLVTIVTLTAVGDSRRSAQGVRHWRADRTHGATIEVVQDILAIFRNPLQL